VMERLEENRQWRAMIALDDHLIVETWDWYQKFLAETDTVFFRKAQLFEDCGRTVAGLPLGNQCTCAISTVEETEEETCCRVCESDFITLALSPQHLAECNCIPCVQYAGEYQSVWKCAERGVYTNATLQTWPSHFAEDRPIMLGPVNWTPLDDNF
jgi:hypothetical protein